jgi:predicted TIM-barrel fold metal-dependent hydrolase
MASFQVAAVARVAKRYPALKIVLCHLLAPTLKDTAALMESLPVLKMDNVWFDLAALPANVSPEKYPYPTAQNFLKAARRIVGAQKLIWGTDLPSVLVRESYDNLFRYITETAIFSDSELKAVFYDNAMAAYPF